MFAMFLICATLGGTVFLAQFVMTIVGFGAGDMDLDADFVDGDAPLDFDMDDAASEVQDHGSSWIFGVISFRTVVAALTFFGLSGLAAHSAEQSPLTQVLIAFAAGAAAMYGVHFIIQTFYDLRHDGTVSIQGSVGRAGTVYVPIPGNRSGAGKIQVKMDNRVMEYKAVTAGPTKLTTGAEVEVVNVVASDTVEVMQPPTQST